MFVRRMLRIVSKWKLRTRVGRKGEGKEENIVYIGHSNSII